MPSQAIPLPTAPATRPARLPSVRTLLLWLVLACLLPAAIGAGILSQIRLQDGRAELQNSAIQATRALVQAVDGQLAKATLLAQALAASESLARGDLAQFHQRAQRLLDDAQIGQSVLLVDIDGQQRVNTLRPFGQRLPRHADLAHIARVFASARAAVSQVVPSLLTGHPVLSVAVPVFSGKKVVYALCVEIAPQQLASMVRAQRLPPQWVATLVDGAGTIAERTPSPEKFAGKKAPPVLLEWLQQALEGSPDMTTPEGGASLLAYTRSPISGWSVFIDVPRRSLEAPLMRAIVLRCLGIGLIFCTSIGVAWFVGGRILRSTRALAASAIALGAGDVVKLPLVYLREADDIGQAMVTASRLLNERMRALEASHAAILMHEADLTQVQRIAKIGGWHWDAGTDVTLASPELCRIFGRTDFPLFSQQCDVLFPREAWRTLNDAVEKCVRTGIGYDMDLPALRGDGSHLWVNTRSEAVRNAGGEVTGMRGMVQDITERKQAESIAKNERFIKAITDAMPGTVGYWNRELRCRFANQAYLAWFGKRPEDIVGNTMLALLGAPLFALNEGHIRAALAGERQDFERTLRKADGTTAQTWIHYIPDLDAYGEVMGFFVLVNDVTQFKMAQVELKLAANVYQHTVDAIMVTDFHGRILSVNPAFSTLTGYSAQEAIGQTPGLLKSNRHERDLDTSVWQQMASSGQWEGEIWHRRKQGEKFLAWQTVTRIAGVDGEAQRDVSVFRDITATWSKNERNKHLAFHDALTKLPNRALLMERLEHHIVLAERDPRALAVLFLDLDQFKSVNDRLGHGVGDAVLVAVAHKLAALVRHSDTVARLGGDEFVLLLERPEGREEVVQIAERIIASIGEPMHVRGETIKVGTSIGIALFPADGSTAAQLIDHADSAMYASKHAGKNTYRFFLPGAVADGRQTGVDG